MYAIVQTGGKQYKVACGDTFCVEKLDAEVGSKVELKDVLAISDGNSVKLGAPYIDGAVVKAEVLEQGKGQKVVIYKYKAKKDEKKKKGHRQPFTKLTVLEIAGAGMKDVAKDAPKAEVKAEAKVEEKAEAKTEVKAEGTPNLKAMKKAELQEFATSKGIEVSLKLTKDEMIAAIEAALK